MTARSRPPTDEPTEVYDGTPLPRPRSATKQGAGVELGTPTELSPPRLPPGVPPPLPPRLPGEQAAQGAKPPAAVPGRDASGPIHVISMKAASDRQEEPREVKQHKVQLRTLSELGRRHATPPGGLGNFAPPRDAREARTRRWRDYVIWGSVAVILACAIMLGVWFLGRT